MPTEADVLTALRPVQDPELHRSIVDLGMVKSITIDGGAVTVQVALTVPGCPMKAEIERRVTEAVTPLDGVDSVAIDLTVMTPQELEAVRGKVQGGGGGGDTNPFTDSSTRVIAVASGKGGGGKSSVTANLAVSLAKLGYKVAAVDADVWGFSLPRMLGVERPPTVLDDMMIPPEAHGVKLISMGFFIREDQPVIWRGPMLHKALEQFLTDVFWDEPDFLLVDMPPGTGDVSLSIAQFLPRAEVVIVTTPQPAAQKVAQRAGAMAKKVNLPVAGVVENMSWFRADDGTAYEIFGEGGGHQLADDFGVPLLGQIPLVSALREGGDVGTPITVVDPDHEASKVFEAIAQTIAVDLAPKRRFNKELKIIE